LVVPWGEEKYVMHSGDTRKGIISKAKKITMTEEYMFNSEKNDFPGAKYELQDPFKLRVHGSKCD
jgi:hypothetical protein